VAARPVLLAAFLACTAVSRLSAQATTPRLSVRLAVTADTDGVVETALLGALRSISDIDVVPIGQPADFTVLIIASCRTPEVRCRSLYILSFTVTRSVDAADLASALEQVRSVRGPAPVSAVARRRLASALATALASYQWYEGGGTDALVAEDLDTDSRAFIARLNASCFEAWRLFYAIGSASYRGDTLALGRLLEDHRRRRALC